jgi:hypothetical protein
MLLEWVWNDERGGGDHITVKVTTRAGQSHGGTVEGGPFRQGALLVKVLLLL